jgi:hypothetical protein
MLPIDENGDVTLRPGLNSEDTVTKLTAEEHLEHLLSFARNIIYNQDDIIQSMLYQMRKTRKMLNNRIKSGGDMIPISNSFGKVQFLDIEALRLEELQIETEKQWLNEERKLLKLERVHLEKQKMNDF